jgi:glutathione S-transferase
MGVKLHRSSTRWKFGPCWRVQKALDEQGIAYEVVKGPARLGKRADLQRLSGQKLYPVIEFENGSIYREESKEMAATIRARRLDEKPGRGHLARGERPAVRASSWSARTPPALGGSPTARIAASVLPRMTPAAFGALLPRAVASVTSAFAAGGFGGWRREEADQIADGVLTVPLHTRHLLRNLYLQGFFERGGHERATATSQGVSRFVQSTFGPRVGHEILSR